MMLRFFFFCIWMLIVPTPFAEKIILFHLIELLLFSLGQKLTKHYWCGSISGLFILFY